MVNLEIWCHVPAVRDAALIYHCVKPEHAEEADRVSKTRQGCDNNLRAVDIQRQDVIGINLTGRNCPLHGRFDDQNVRGDIHAQYWKPLLSPISDGGTG
jgi:hypothetical protein